MITKNALLVFLSCASLSEGFITTNGVVSSRQPASSTSSVVLRLSSPEEERAAVLSNYLAKAHEDKLRAVQAAEAKKNEEIIMLKEMLKASQAQGPAVQQAAEIAAPAPSKPTAALTISEPPVDSNLLAMSPEALVGLVQKYKHFVANYVADAQQQKAEAVKAAEEALTQKYEARLQALAGGGIPAAEAPFKVVDPAPKVVEKAPAEAPSPQVYAAAKPTDLYAKRNARLEAAALAGKSRWGSMEVAKVAINNAKNPQAAVEEADHGLRNDGGVGGPTLAERVSMGAGSAATGAKPRAAETPHFANAQVADTPLANGAPEPVIPSVNVAPLYAKRNAKVVASAKVGKSRWGEMEIEKIKTSVNSNSDAEIAAADHGLRNDGGVSGPSLAERVNLGAMLLGVDPLGSDPN